MTRGRLPLQGWPPTAATVGLCPLNPPLLHVSLAYDLSRQGCRFYSPIANYAAPPGLGCSALTVSYDDGQPSESLSLHAGFGQRTAANLFHPGPRDSMLLFLEGRYPQLH